MRPARLFYTCRRWLLLRWKRLGPDRDLQHGDIVRPHEVVDLYHGARAAEDGRLIRMFDLIQGRTGVQAWRPGEKPGPIVVVD